MNKKLSLMMAALIAAGYSVTAEAGIVKTATVKADTKYVIAVDAFTVNGDQLLLTTNTSFHGINVASLAEITDEELWTAATATGGVITNAATGEQITQTEKAASMSKAGVTFTGVQPLITGNTPNVNLLVKDPAAFGTTESAANAHFYSLTTPVAKKLTGVYVTLNDKYLVNTTGTTAVLLDGTTVVMLGLQDKAKWDVDADGKIVNDNNGIIALTSSSITIDAKVGALPIEKDLNDADNKAVYTTVVATGVSTVVSGVTTENFKVDAAAPSLAINVPDGALAWTNGTTGVLYVNPAEDATAPKAVTAKGTTTEAGVSNVALTIKLNADGSYSLFNGNAQVSLDSEVSFTVVKAGNGFTLKNADGEVLTIKAEAFAWKNANDIATGESVAVFSFSKGTLQTISAADLAKIQNGGITLTASYDNGKTDIKGNPFTGFLTVEQASDANSFYLKSGKKYIIGRKDMIEGAETVAYGFTTVELSDMKDGDKAVFTAKTYAGEGTTPSEIVLTLTGTGTTGTVGYYKVPDAVYMGAGDAPKNVTFSLGAGTAVKPSDLLVKGKFFSFVKVDKEDGNKTLAVKLKGDVPTTSACGEAAFLKDYNNELEAQWALTVNGANYVFTNRESKGVTYTLPTTGLYRAEGNDTYTYTATDGENVTCIIAPIDSVNAADGYVRLNNLKNTRYNLGYWSNTFNGTAWFTENHKDVKKDFHIIGLDQENDALEFAVVGFSNKKDADKNVASDSIYVISTLGYYNANGIYDTTLDTLKVVSYSFINQYNEPLKMGEDVEGEPAYGSVANKYESMAEALEAVQDVDNTVAQKFTLRKDGDKLNLRPVSFAKADGQLYREFSMTNDYNKMYSGDTKNGILNDTKMYGRAENDLFVIEETAKPMYRTVVNNLDTIAIYRNGAEKSILFEKGMFLGMENLAEYPAIAPAMVADLAYVDKEGHHPEYMLMVEPEFVVGGKWCPEHGFNSGCPHEVKVPDYTKGRYLVSLKDTAVAWEANKVHGMVNPYINTENNYKLGFVPASHLADTLIIASDSNKIQLNNENYNVAKFSFRYVDNEDQSFVIETADYKRIPEGKEAGKFDEDKMGYLKWMNGVVIVVNDIKNADIYNMTEGYEGNPTANEGINAASVSVIAGNGSVTINGAAGKKVVITNVLGQTVANTVLSSDNATISAPAGIVVVAVEGEAAVKAIVK